MTDRVPDLSVVILSHNRVQMLKDCLASLLAQDVEPGQLEILVVDDGSGDGTAEYMQHQVSEHSQVRYLPQPHLGIPSARNHGIREAKGKAIAFVANDYILRPDYARTIIEFLRETPEASAVRFRIVASRKDYSSSASHLYYEVGVRNRIGAENSAGVDENVTKKHSLEAAGAAAFRRKVFEEVGHFDETLMRGEDTDFGRRMSRQGKSLFFHPQHTVKHQYAVGMLDTVNKCFETGQNHYHLARKYRIDDAKPVANRSTGQWLANSWRNARSLKPGLSFWAYLPALFLFESMQKLGYAWESVSSRVSGNSANEA